MIRFWVGFFLFLWVLAFLADIYFQFSVTVFVWFVPYLLYIL